MLFDVSTPAGRKEALAFVTAKNNILGDLAEEEWAWEEKVGLWGLRGDESHYHYMALSDELKQEQKIIEEKRASIEREIGEVTLPASLLMDDPSIDAFRKATGIDEFTWVLCYEAAGLRDQPFMSSPHFEKFLRWYEPEILIGTVQHGKGLLEKFDELSQNGGE